MPHTLGPGAYYAGTSGRLINTRLPDGRNPRVGDTFTIASRVKNEGTEVLYLTVRYEIHRFDDGRNIEIRAGQNYGGGGLGEPLPFEYFYADGYLGGGAWGVEHGWSNPGALVGEPDGSFSESTTASAETGWYTFEDVTLSGRIIQNIDLEGYTRQPAGISNDFDPYIYIFDPAGDDTGSVQHGAWCDSLGGSPTWAWTGGRYYQGGPYDMPEYYGTIIHTEDGFNDMQMFVYNYGSSGQIMQIDALRWKVEYASITPTEPEIYTVMPGMEFDVPPVVWPVTEEQVGDYELTATIEYSAVEIPTFRHYNSIASKQVTFPFTIKP
jgi:hypothetical protein